MVMMNNFNDNVRRYIIDEEFDKEESWADYMDRNDSEVHEKQVISELKTEEKAKQPETEASINTSSEEGIIHTETAALQQTPGAPAEDRWEEVPSL